MDFVVLGFGTGALAILLGFGLRDLGPWFGRVSPWRELAPSQVARLVAWGRGCRAGGLVLALAGGAVLLATFVALVAGAGDRAGLILVAATLVLAVGAALTWLLRYLRFAHPDLWSARRRAAEPVAPAVTVDQDLSALDREPVAAAPSPQPVPTDAWWTTRPDQSDAAPTESDEAAAVIDAAPSAPPVEPVVVADPATATDDVMEPETEAGPIPAPAASEADPDRVAMPPDLSPVVQTAAADDPVSALDPDPSAALAEPDQREERDEPPADAVRDEAEAPADPIPVASNGRPPVDSEQATDDRPDPLVIGPASRRST